MVQYVFLCTAQTNNNYLQQWILCASMTTENLVREIFCKYLALRTRKTPVTLCSDPDKKT